MEPTEEKKDEEKQSRTRQCISNFWTWCCAKPLLALAMVWPLTVLVVGIVLMVLGAFGKSCGFNWGQVAEYVQTFGYLSAASGLCLGLHYTGQRTEALIDRNELQAHSDRTDSFAKALESLESSNIYIRLGAIKALEHLGCEKSQLFYEQVVSVLSAFLVTTSQDEIHSRPYAPEKREVYAAFLSLCAIENAHAENSKYISNRIDLTSVNLSGFKSGDNLIVRNMNLQHGDFSSTHFRNARFDNVDFYFAILDEADFSKATFSLSSNLSMLYNAHTNISGTDFSEVDPLDLPYQLEEANYDKDNPPIGLCTGIGLPAPAENPYSTEPERLSSAEAKSFWNEPGNDKYRPRDRDGNLIKIVYPEDSGDDPD
ncbi:pentapeptide repeat-containing protein [Alphaproteobacteria bacterium]|nr:pentapeptide repeat-containing protein [Alphaproteobacteria bacterium]